MPILAFAHTRQDLLPTQSSPGRRTLIQVSDQARRELEAMILPDERCCTAEHLVRLQVLAATREADSELALLLRAIESNAEVYLQFI
jgi:hypothetical protein